MLPFRSRFVLLAAPILLVLVIFPTHRDGLHHFYNWNPSPQEMTQMLNDGRMSMTVATAILQGHGTIDYRLTLWEALLVLLSCFLVTTLWPFLKTLGTRGLRNGEYS
jgi:hypothetical protein